MRRLWQVVIFEGVGMVRRGMELLALTCLAVIPYCSGCAELGSGTPQKEAAAANQQSTQKSDTERPRLLKVSGLLVDHEGKPPAGVVGVLFAIYEQHDDVTPLWQEVQNVSADPRGRFSVVLGSTGGGIPANFLTNENTLWLGEQIMLTGEQEKPRVRLISVAQFAAPEDLTIPVNGRQPREQATQADAQPASGDTAGSQQPSQQDQSEPDDKPQTARRRLRRRPTE